MLCEVCEAEEAAFTIIPTGEGMPQVLGASCFARSGLELAKAILPPEEIAQTLGPMFVAGIVAEEVNGPGQAAPKRGRKSKAEAEAVEGPTGGQAEEPPAAANE